jgi:thiamine-phosphate diphosphorylase
VFATASKPGAATLGVEGLRAVCEAVRIPVVAIGGITAENAASVVAAGATGIAVIGAIFDAPDPGAAAASLRHALEAAAAGATPRR